MRTERAQARDEFIERFKARLYFKYFFDLFYSEYPFFPLQLMGH